MSTLKKENSTMKLRFMKGTRTLPQLTHAYRPELHREVTERVPVSRLGRELTQLCHDGLGEAFDAGAMSQAKLELSDLVVQMMPSLKRNKLGLEFLPPVTLDCFAHWHVQPETTVVCLVPVLFPQAKVIQKDIGHALIKIPAPAATGAQDPYNSNNFVTTTAANSNSSSHSSSCSSSNNTTTALPARLPNNTNALRSKDGSYVSPRKLHVQFAKLAHGTLLKTGLEPERVKDEKKGDNLVVVVVALENGWRAELVPCVAVTGVAGVTGVTGPRGKKGGGADVEAAGVYYVSRRFHGEPKDKGGHNAWTPCSCAKEQDLLRSISSTDDGLRLLALFALCQMVARDWRLEHLTCYDLQTVLLHDTDFHVDYSPRWQRSTLESCLRSLLKTLLYFVEREALPHFDMNQFNLWQHRTQRQMALARGALSRLLSNENALISLVRRAAAANGGRTGRRDSSSRCQQSVDFGWLGIG